MSELEVPEVVVFEKDVPLNILEAINSNQVVAWDTEMSGLDWKTDRIATCQLYTPGQPVAIIRIRGSEPEKLKGLLGDAAINKIFHFAIGDLRFMSHHWNVSPQNVSCTKIASKILCPHPPSDHTLKGLLGTHLGIHVSKEERLSNWFAEKLTENQLKYAANDVFYLLALLDAIKTKLMAQDHWELALEAFHHIPTRVKLDLLDYDDIYIY